MDLHMPRMDGLEASRRIMEETPTPIVLVTSSGSRQNQQFAFQALEAGVLAVVAKPESPNGGPAVAELRRTIKSMAQVKVIRRWASGQRRPPTTPTTYSPPLSVKPPVCQPEVVAMGASTGGPQALREILTQLPSTFPVPVLVVQHIAPGFAAGMVDWLRPECPLPIQLATGGIRLDRPAIYVAPTGEHLVVRGRALALTHDPPVSGHRPSATVLFQSVAREYGAAAVGILLSGMGDDGAAGLRDLKRAGATTIAQDEASSVVFGMPAVAISFGVVDHVLAPRRIPPLLLRLVEARRPGQMT
jgi:two-component system chemotaxis response regulator CheB